MTNTFDITSFSKAVKEERKKHNKSLRDMGKAWVINHVSIARAENGNTPDLYTLLYLCDCLNVPATTFIKTKK